MLRNYTHYSLTYIYFTVEQKERENADKLKINVDFLLAALEGGTEGSFTHAKSTMRCFDIR